MQGATLAVASGKGGVGKTTTVANLGIALWREGLHVGMLDADLGMPDLAPALGLEQSVTLHDVLAGEASVSQAGLTALDGEITVIPGDDSLTGYAHADPKLLRGVLNQFAPTRDIVLIDTGAGLSYEDILPLQLADSVLLITTPDPIAIGDTRKTLELAEMVDTPVLGVVVNRGQPDTDPDTIAEAIGAELLGMIPDDSAVSDSMAQGTPLFTYAPNAPAALAYKDLAKNVLEATALQISPNRSVARTLRENTDQQSKRPPDESARETVPDQSSPGSPAHTASRWPPWARTLAYLIGGLVVLGLVLLGVFLFLQGGPGWV